MAYSRQAFFSAQYSDVELLDGLHWEIEFPDIFSPQKTGFDAILGNPPWDTLQPMSAEFFTRYDPIFRTYGKQEAINHQNQLFEDDSNIKKEWLYYLSYFSNLTNWVKNVANPFGDPLIENCNTAMLQSGKENLSLHNIWREQRKSRTGYADCKHPYLNLGSGKSYTYKMFLDLGHSLLSSNGRLGMIVPSSIYSTSGSVDLRSLFLNKCNWEWLFGFENRKKIFDIHGSFKFGPIIIEKGGTTNNIKTAFMRHDLSDWEEPDRFVIEYKKEFVDLFSPKNKLFLEITSKEDTKILEEIYNRSIPLNDNSENGWSIKFSQGDFNMTSDSKLFPPITDWINRGYIKNEYCNWINLKGDIALPLYEGRMIGQFDFSKKGWISGKGRTAVWREIPLEKKDIEPQYLINKSTYDNWHKGFKGYKVGFMDVSSATNTRSMISCLIVNMPCGHKVPFLQIKSGNLVYSLVLTAILNSLCYDYTLRNRFGGNSLTYVIIEETPLPKLKNIEKNIIKILNLYTARLTFNHILFSPEWLRLKQLYPDIHTNHWKALWAITNHEHLRLRCIIDAIVAELYGMSYDDLKWILRDDQTDPKGFWRVDKRNPYELRQTSLTLQALKRLKEVGLDAFCKEDWQFPEEIQQRLGPRFLPWQLEGTPEESWEECKQHAKNILGEEKYKQFINDLNNPEKDIETYSFCNNKNEIKKLQKSIFSWGDEK